MAFGFTLVVEREAVPADQVLKEWWGFDCVIWVMFSPDTNLVLDKYYRAY
jgi:hypothetical protein